MKRSGTHTAYSGSKYIVHQILKWKIWSNIELIQVLILIDTL